MKVSTKIIGMLVSTIMIFGCAKPKEYEKCDHANVCVKNISTSKLPYSWGSSDLKDTLLPGQTACKDAGYLDTDPQNETYSIVYFMTPNKSTAIKPTSCNMTVNVP